MIYEFVSYDNPTFLAFSIERVLLRDSENDLQGTYTVKFNEKDWGKYATYKMILPRVRLFGQVHRKQFALLTVIANDLFAVFPRGK